VLPAICILNSLGTRKHWFYVTILVVLEERRVAVLCGVFLLLQPATGLMALTIARLPVVSGLCGYFHPAWLFHPGEICPEFFSTAIYDAAVDHILLDGGRPLQRGKNHAAGIVDIRGRIVHLGSWHVAAAPRF
jgi:hypothetical protein